MSGVCADRFESSELARLIVAIGTCAGVAGGIVAAGLPLVAPNLFTHDLALYPIMHSVLPQVGWDPSPCSHRLQMRQVLDWCPNS